MSTVEYPLFYTLTKISIEILIFFVYNASMVLCIQLRKRRFENYVHSKCDPKCLSLGPQRQR